MRTYDEIMLSVCEMRSALIMAGGSADVLEVGVYQANAMVYELNKTPEFARSLLRGEGGELTVDRLSGKRCLGMEVLVTDKNDFIGVRSNACE